jgi:anti-sigma regulatory factor (Ser/Thr protein kinase)
MTAYTAANGELELELPSEPASVSKARSALAGVARRLGAREEDVKLAVSEAVSNAVVHAFGEESGTITLRAWREQDRLDVLVSDDGGGMMPKVDRAGLGLGISMITRLAAEVRFDSSEQGTAVHMSFPTVGAS